MASPSSSISLFNAQSLKRTHDFFGSQSDIDPSLSFLVSAPSTKKPKLNSTSEPSLEQELSPSEIKLSVRILDTYSHVKDLPPPGGIKKKESGVEFLKRAGSKSSSEVQVSDTSIEESSVEIDRVVSKLSEPVSKPESSQALVKSQSSQTSSALSLLGMSKGTTRVPWEDEKPVWHAPWELMTVIAGGHVGWVRCVTVDPTNSWFATGSSDRTIKIWDLAKRQLKLTLTGHVAGVRSVVASERHPYLFSAGEDKQLFCWDLESNKNIRHYFGHRSGIYSLALHPELDLIISGSRDRSVCVWDMRSRVAVHTFSGHSSTVFSVAAQASEPQIISGSADTTIKCWDLVAGKTRSTLTNHSKAVRDILLHPTENTMCSAGADALKRWKFPDGNFINNFEGHKGIVNGLAINHENVMVSASDNGILSFWDWKTAHKFYETETIAQSGSVASEAGFFDVAFDKTGSRLITCEADKSIKIWRENPNATPETHPLQWKPKKHKIQW